MWGLIFPGEMRGYYDITCAWHWYPNDHANNWAPPWSTGTIGEGSSMKWIL